MKRNFVRAILVFAAVIFAAVISGGCGGSSGGIVTIPDNPTEPTPQTSARYVLAGSLTEARFDGSDLTPYIREKITESITMSDIDGAINVIDSLTSGDFLFFGNADDNMPKDTTYADVLALYASLMKAYEKGVAFVTVYAGSGDIEAMNGILSLSLARPDEKAPLPFFELVGVAHRPLSDGTSHVFTYVAKCRGNHEYYNGIISNGASADIAPGLSVSGERNEELCRSRVQALFDWEAGLDARAEEMSASISAAVEKLVKEAGLKDELLSVAQGMTTDIEDNMSMPFAQYYYQNVYGRVDKQGGLMPAIDMFLPKDYSVNRKTHSKHQVISVHSFDDHNDYYVVISQTETQPTVGSYSGISLLSGFTKSLSMYVWPSVKADRLARYVPNEVVNQNRTYTDSSSWSSTNSISVTHKTGVNMGAGVKGEVPEASVGVTQETTEGYTYSNTLTHTSGTTWTAQDYEIIPLPYTDSGTRVAKWTSSVTWPDNGRLSTAAGTALMLKSESIFRAGLNEADSFDIFAKTGWGDGITYSGYGTNYQLESLVDGAVTKLNMLRPLHTAVTGAAYDGDGSQKMYLVMFNTESSWTAETDSDWITLQPTSGGAGSCRMNYEVKANDTGAMRQGVITIKSGKDTVYIPFTQASGAMNR